MEELERIQAENLKIVEEVRKMFAGVSRHSKYGGFLESQSFSTGEISVYWRKSIPSYNVEFPDKEIIGKESPSILIEVPGNVLYLTRNGGIINNSEFTAERRKASEDEVIFVLEMAQKLLTKYVASLAMPKVLEMFNEKSLGFRDLKKIEEVLREVGAL